MCADASKRNFIPLAGAAIALVSCVWLFWHGARGWRTSQLHGEMGEGLLSSMIIAMALWAAFAAAGQIWLWRRSATMAKKHFAVAAAVSGLVGLGPPLLASYWLLELVLWRARYG